MYSFVYENTKKLRNIFLFYKKLLSLQQKLNIYHGKKT